MKKLVRNPILRGYKPDPSVTKGHDGNYYMVTSTFEYYPLIPIFKSSDLVNWEIVNYALYNENLGDLILNDVPDSQGIFAPTIRYYNNKYYLLCTIFNTRYKDHTKNFIMTANTPEELWSKPTILPELQGIDPSIFFENGKGYIHYASWIIDRSAVKQVEINLDTFERTTEPQILTYGNGGRDPEAPHIYEKDGKYYLLLAEGGTREGHMVTIFKSDNVWGPYEPHPNNPILTHRDFASNQFQNIGHGELVEKDGEWFIFVLGVRPKGMGKHNLGRETFIKKIKWEGDWPEIEGPVNLFEELEVEQVLINEINTDFTKEDNLALDWFTIRDDISNRYQLDENGLTLNGSKDSIDQALIPSVILRSQEEYNFTFKTTLDLEKSKGDNGIIVLSGSQNYFNILVNADSDKLLVVTKGQCYNLVDTKEFSFDKAKEVSLVLKSDELNYKFYLEIQGEELFISELRREILATEVSSSPFTGVVYGFYVEGENSSAVYKGLNIVNKLEEYKK